MKKKILLLGNHGFVIYNFRKELIQQLLSNGYEVYISLPYDKKVDLMISWGCKFVETEVDRRGKNPLQDAKLLIHYLKVIKEVQPDYVLTYTIKPNLYGGIACRFLKVPYLTNITGLGSGFSGNGYLKKFLTIMYKLGLRKSNCVFFQNTEDMNTLKKLNVVKGKHRLIPGSGVNISDFKYVEYPNKEEINFLFIGRIMKDKGIDQYLEAAKIVKTKYENVNFNIVGFIEDSQSHYKNVINDYEKKSFVNYLGYKYNVRPFIEEAHCLVQPSHGGEGLSNVLLEAAATGRPLIASDIAGCRETIEESKNGFTFKSKNTEDLVFKIEKFLELDNYQKAEMGNASRIKIAHEFNRELVVKAYFEELKKVD